MVRGAGGRAGSAAERLSRGDALELATDVGPAPKNIAALLTLDGTVPGSVVVAALAARLGSVRRLRQVVVTRPGPLAALRPHAVAWRDDPEFRAGRHVTSRSAPGDHAALLRLTAELAVQRLPRERPLWRAVVVTAPDGSARAVVVVLHHVVADGAAALSLLADLADEPPAVDPPGGGAAHRTGGGAGHRAGSGRQAQARRGWLAPATALNAPTGPRRAVATAQVELAAVRAAARRLGATVNDLLLVVVAEAMAAALRERGQDVAELVVSVPVARGSGGERDLGNDVGVLPVRVPTRGPVPDRVAAVAARTAAGRARPPRGLAVMGAAFRLLVAARAFRFFVERQPLVNTFLSNLRGPTARLSLAGSTVEGVVPVVVTPGNIAVTFGALSYAGTLTVVVTADPDITAGAPVIADAVAAGLRAISAAARPGPERS